MTPAAARGCWVLASARLRALCCKFSPAVAVAAARCWCWWRWRSLTCYAAPAHRERLLGEARRELGVVVGAHEGEAPCEAQQHREALLPDLSFMLAKSLVIPLVDIGSSEANRSRTPPASVSGGDPLDDMFSF